MKPLRFVCNACDALHWLLLDANVIETLVKYLSKIFLAIRNLKKASSSWERSTTFLAIEPKNETTLKKLHRQEAPNSVGGRKPMYQIQATVAMEQ